MSPFLVYSSMNFDKFISNCLTTTTMIKTEYCHHSRKFPLLFVVSLFPPQAAQKHQGPPT